LNEKDKPEQISEVKESYATSSEVSDLRADVIKLEQMTEKLNANLKS
jgi:polyhydroxyalkanoate synthesis regulator phasin